MGDRLQQLLEGLSEGWEGEIRLRDGAHAHRVLVRQGRPVAVRIVGHFDPLLRRLERSGDLDSASRARILEALTRSERRVGELARAEGVAPLAIERALANQLRDGLRLLARRMSATTVVDCMPRRVSAGEVAAWLPRPSSSRPRGRRALRRLARQLHPDRLQHLPEAERRRRAEQLARLNALAQGL